MKVQVNYSLTDNYMVNVSIKIISIELDIHTKLFIPWLEGDDVVVDVDNFEYGQSDIIEKEFENLSDAEIWISHILELLRRSLKKIKDKFAKLPEPVIYEIDGQYIKKI